MRSLVLALLALALAAPSAQASVADQWIPIKAASDGVTVKRVKGGYAMRFSQRADRLYRSFGGRRASAVCGRVTENQGAEVAFSGGIGVLARKRQTLHFGARDADMCAVLTKRSVDDDCVHLRGDEGSCVRVIVAASDDGRAYLDSAARSFEIGKVSDLAVSLPRDWAPTLLELLQGAVGPDVVILDAPDATPPAGKVGYWEQGASRATIAVLADGSRRFHRYDGDVFSTNDPWRRPDTLEAFHVF